MLAKKALTLFGVPHTRKLCPSCEESAVFLRRETLLPLPEGARAPLSKRPKVGHVCFDCASAEDLMRLGLDWYMARIAVANDRREKLRLPGARYGLPTTKVSQPGDLDRLHEWQDEVLPEEDGCLPSTR